MNAPLTVAVVGSGPAGFYTAGALLNHDGQDVRVDLYERLATPWGLVRAGVAPDHPKIKSVSSVYTKIAAEESFRFFGNVHVGGPDEGDITREELAERYDAVVYTVGAQSDRKLGIPGEELPGCVAALDFVGWYNGHPDFADLSFDLSSRRAVVIGAGNVALDVARILCSPVERLAKTDIADHALVALADSSIEEVVVVGRRGPVQAAFTTPELKELPEYTESGVLVHPEDLPDADEDDALPRAVKRNVAIMRDYAAGKTPLGKRHIALRFLRSPIELRGTGRVEEIMLGRNALKVAEDGWVAAVDTGERESLDTGLVLRAVGYKGLPIAGLPYDQRKGVIPNTNGRVDGTEREYVAGWIKRGPTGIIGTNKKCAVETVTQLLADLESGELRRHDRDAFVDDVAAWLAERQPHLVTQEGWRLIDAAERAAGEPHGRPRVKLVGREQLLGVALGRAEV
ncbi:MAG: FAD-dependent oxidoreductase [Pseudonocardiales bacterium]|nr:FAD-dependent oxidoreductase [Pseudonocardiales bacterium]